MGNKLGRMREGPAGNRSSSSNNYELFRFVSKSSFQARIDTQNRCPKFHF